MQRLLIQLQSNQQVQLQVINLVLKEMLGILFTPEDDVTQNEKTKANLKLLQLLQIVEELYVSAAQKHQLVCDPQF